MSVQLSDEAQEQATASLQRFCTEELDVSLSGIQITMLLKFVLAEIAPSAYNAGVAAAEAFLRDRLADLEATWSCEREFFPQIDATTREERHAGWRAALDRTLPSRFPNLAT